MNDTLTKDARGFVDGVVSVLKNNNKTTSIAPKMQIILSKMAQQSKRGRMARVETSIALDVKEKEALVKTLSKVFDREITIEETIVSDLIGGIRIKLDDWVFDSSMRTQLVQMADSIMEEHV